MYSKEVLDKVKEQILKEAEIMRSANKEVPVSGERIDIPCKNRKVNIVYYRCGKKDDVKDMIRSGEIAEISRRALQFIKEEK